MKNRYVIYNKFTRTAGNIKELLDDLPVKLIDNATVNARGLIGVSIDVNDQNTESEVKVSWYTEDYYWTWRNNTNYDTDKEILETYFHNNGITFERFTSNDNYCSKNLDKPKLICNIKMTDLQKRNFLDDICPIGYPKIYTGNGNFRKFPINSSRFLNNRKSNIVRRGHANKAIGYKNYPNDLLTYDFDHAVDYIMYSDHQLWRILKKLIYDIEQYTATLINSCSHSAVLIGHSSMGNGIVIHSHRLDTIDKPTLTITVKITHDDEKNLKIHMYPPFKLDDTNLPYYYSDLQLLHKTIDKNSFTSIEMLNRASIMIFNGSYTPHSTTWTDDIYLFFVYDNVTFHTGKFNYFRQSTTTIIDNNSDNLSVFYIE